MVSRCSLSDSETAGLTHCGLVTPYMSLENLGNIGSWNGLSPNRHPATTWTNGDLLSFEPQGTYQKWNFIWKSNIFIQQNAFEIVVGKTSAILLGPQYVNLLWPTNAIWWHRSGSTLAHCLLPDGTKPLPKPMLTYHLRGPVTITWGQFHRYLSHRLLKLIWKLLI